VVARGLLAAAVAVHQDRHNVADSALTGIFSS
jgi:hypothetical protein